MAAEKQMWYNGGMNDDLHRNELHWLKILLAVALAGPAVASGAFCADFNVTRYGAKPDGATDSTAAIQRAIDECCASGGGRVLVPGGGRYVTYTLSLKSNVDLHIERGATLLGGENPLKYPLFETNDVWNAERAPRFNRRAMFYTVGQTNVAITGAGTIDGNAEKFHHDSGRKTWTGYSWVRNSHTNITGRCVFFVGCRDVRLDDVLILHPAGWSTWFLDCDRVGVRGVRIEADRRFSNGDGLHFGGCRDVTVSDCIVHSQDDAFIVRTHQEQMKKPRPCERVVVNNCIFNSYGAFAIRIGWRGDGPVKDVSFNNIVSTGSRWGVGFTVPDAPKGEDMDPPRGRGLVPPPPESLLPFSAENIRFSNMDVVCDGALDLLSLGRTTPVAFLKNVSFSHCHFKLPGPPIVKFRPQDNVRDWRFDDVTFDVLEPGSGLGEAESWENAFMETEAFSCANVAFRYRPRPPFWNMEVEIDDEGSPLVVESVHQKCDVQGDSFIYGPLVCGDRTLDMKVVVTARMAWMGKAYSGHVENNDRRARVTMFNGPKLDKVSLDPANAKLYIPSGFGRRLNYFPLDAKDAAPWIPKSHSLMCLETGIYPSRYLTMPWMALETGVDGATWYAAVHDAKERSKSIGVRWYHRERRADVRFRHPVSIRAGGKWELPETVFEKVDGDWHAAAKRYRAWFDSAHKAVRSAAPDWTRDLTGWLLVIMKQQNEQMMWPYADIPKLCDVAERNGLNAIGLFGWTVGGHDHLYPDYAVDPKMGGAEALRAGIAEAHRRGIRVCIYANGQLQQIGATKFWGEHGERLAVRRRDGKPYVKTYHKYGDIPVYQFAIGCLYGKAWHDRMFSLARQARGFGADAILYDQLGVTTPFECWGEGHGHPVPWQSHAEERPGFVRNIADLMHETDRDFAVFTEGLHDGLLDAIGMFHACQPGAFMSDVNALRAARTSGKPVKAEPFPELFRYTFPELVTTTRNPTPMTPRAFVNYAAVFGLRHEIEVRYMPDRTYVLDGKVPAKADYGEVKNLPSLQAMRAEPPGVASAYMKAVGDFQRKHAKYLLRGKFKDEEGFLVRGDGLLAKRFMAADDTDAICVWNISEKPLPVVIEGMEKPRGVFAPAGEKTDGPLAANSIRLYVYGD